MAKRVNITIRADFKFQLYAEDNDIFTTVEFIAMTKALRDALEGILDGSDTIHDYVGETLPDGVDLSVKGIGEVALSGIGGGREE